MLANAQKFEIENLSAEMNSDGVSFSNEWDNKKIKACIEKDGKIFVNSVIKNGKSEMKYGGSLDVSSISIQCEVTTPVSYTHLDVYKRQGPNSYAMFLDICTHRTRQSYIVI